VVAIPFSPVAINRTADLTIEDLSGYKATVDDRLVMFNMLLVAIDPYTHQSGWILPTAARLLGHYQEADIRCAFLVAGDADGARSYLGPYAEQFLILLDNERALIESLEIEFLPALVHVRQDASVAGSAEGWNAENWLTVLNGVEKSMAWYSRPVLPASGDPGSFAGTPALV